MRPSIIASCSPSLQQRRRHPAKPKSASSCNAVLIIVISGGMYKLTTWNLNYLLLIFGSLSAVFHRWEDHYTATDNIAACEQHSLALIFESEVSKTVKNHPFYLHNSKNCCNFVHEIGNGVAGGAHVDLSRCIEKQQKHLRKSAHAEHWDFNIQK